MKINQHIATIIRKYFDRKESNAERKSLYEWYDDIDNSQKITPERIARLKALNAARLFPLTRPKQVKRLSTFVKVAAAVLLLSGLGYIGLQYYENQQEYVMGAAELAKITPGTDQATITLGSGETIDLENIKLNDSLKIGNTVIYKDEQGQITYAAVAEGLNTADIYTENILQTPKSAQYKVMLSDGTKVTLNAESKLIYPAHFASGKDRIVTLSGEGYFEVSKTSDSRKFMVKTKGQLTEVLGTKFNINAYANSNKTVTTLAEGSIRVQSDNHTIVLQPNQQTVLKDGDLIKQHIDATTAIGWTEGYFYFDNTNAAEIIQQIGRWYDIEVEYDGKTPITYSGKIPKNLNLGKLIELLNYADIKAKAVSNKNNKKKLVIN
ncbi:FecR family protein [Sphingobacterium psychroaquaticum]|uniref:FecR family protein n=1 Tax=Sphingobacterium psychroaquaticum TaxID=561061 RepID=A0A1X7KQR9_9SPHI|nr:FecR family protein [Sphingobacterium psychroaquaticum]QBQ40571.1 FecR family protein [Sphingobacterium psychroaquaticum]SMG43768.1 FecR family protein [Sphingobacterium psychroaquaticum]